MHQINFCDEINVKPSRKVQKLSKKEETAEESKKEKSFTVPFLYVRETPQDYSVCSARKAYDLLEDLKDCDQEVMHVLSLNSQNQLIANDIVALGGINHAGADPKIIFRRVLSHGSTAFIIGHNHPSRNTDPSGADRDFTKRIKTSADTLSLQFLDHIIIGDGYFSFAESGQLTEIG